MNKLGLILLEKERQVTDGWTQMVKQAITDTIARQDVEWIGVGTFENCDFCWSIYAREGGLWDEEQEDIEDVSPKQPCVVLLYLTLNSKDRELWFELVGDTPYPCEGCFDYGHDQMTDKQVRFVFFLCI